MKEAEIITSVGQKQSAGRGGRVEWLWEGVEWTPVAARPQSKSEKGKRKKKCEVLCGSQ